MRQDIHDNVLQKMAKNVGAISSNTTTTGIIIDRANFRTVEFLVFCTAFTDGVFTPLVRDGNDSALGDVADVADDFLLGTEAAAALSAANTVKRVGYNGHKRYLRCDIVSTGVTSGASIGVIAVLGMPLDMPTAGT